MLLIFTLWINSKWKNKTEWINECCIYLFIYCHHMGSLRVSQLLHNFIAYSNVYASKGVTRFGFLSTYITQTRFLIPYMSYHHLLMCMYCISFSLYFGLSDRGWLSVWFFFFLHLQRKVCVLILCTRLYLSYDFKWNWHLPWECVSLLSTPAGLLSQSSPPPCT